MATLDRAEVYRIICTTAVLAALFFAGIVIVHPFIPAILFALIFTVASWPVFLWVEARLKNRTTLAATAMTLALALCFIVPVALLSRNLAGNFAQISNVMIDFFQSKPKAAPGWLAGIPLVGSYAAELWADYINDTAYIAGAIKDNLEFISQQLLKLGAIIGGGIVDLALGIFIAFFLFRHGRVGVRGLKVLLDRYIGPRARKLLDVSRATMNGVIYGLLGTALAQAVVAAAGFSIAHIPGAPLLALLVFLLSAVPIGPPLVWIPAMLWLFSQDKIGMGVFMFFWGLVAISGIDNVIRPYLISQGTRLPLLVVFLGALGGVFTFGFTGFFIGPTILAVIYVFMLEEAGIKR